MSGTSQATPHVAGAVALLASRYPNATASQIKDALLRGANTATSLLTARRQWPPRCRLDNAGVAALAPLELGGELLEQAVHGVLVRHLLHHGAAGVQVAALALGDEVRENSVQAALKSAK